MLVRRKKHQFFKKPQTTSVFLWFFEKLMLFYDLFLNIVFVFQSCIKTHKISHALKVINKVYQYIMQQE